MHYDDSWDRPHAAGDDPLWQESDCYWFYDARARVGGFHRIGQHPRRQGGHSIVFAFAEGGQRFFHHGEVPIGAGDRRASGQTVGISSVEARGGGGMRYAWAHADSEAALVFEEPFYAPRPWRRNHSGETERAMNAEGHLECSGRLRGTLRIGADEYVVDALAHRDRSWGSRDVSMAMQHRMCSGTVGPDLSWAVFSMQLRGHGVQAAGFVARGADQFDVRRARVLATSDIDGFTYAAGRLQLELDNGEWLDIACRVRQGCVNRLPAGYIWTDNIATVDWKGQTGFCDLEIASNPLRGTTYPNQSEAGAACVEQGLSSTVNPGWPEILLP